MGRIETFLGERTFHFLFSARVFFALLFVGRVILFTALEIVRPARKVSYRSVVWNDLAALQPTFSLFFRPLAT